MTTYTFVCYFSDENPELEQLRSAARALRDDYRSRSQWMHPRARVACEARLDLLDGAVELLTEPVPRPFGG